MLQNTIGYYKYRRVPIPPIIMNQLSKYGVNVDTVPTWNGQGDPLQETIDQSAMAQQPQSSTGKQIGRFIVEEE